MGAGAQHEGVGLLKVLALLTRLPHPPWRGDQARAYHHLRLLAPRHDVTVCALVLGRVRAQDVDAVRALGVRVEVVPLGLASGAAGLVSAVVDTMPLQVHLFRRPRAIAHVRALVARERFDVVHAQLVRTGAYWPAGPRPPVVLDLVDALSANFARRAARERGARGRLWALEERRLRRYEQALVARAAATLVVAAPERDAVGGERVVVVPNGVDLERFPFVETGRIPGRIVFAGNLGYFPNVDAAQWLVDEILPAVRTRCPNATVHLAGARPSARVRALATRPGVSLAADVSAMAPEIASGALTVIPMRSGSGLQNKVLEAMAVGTPVVTTPQVVAALAARPGEHLLVGATTDELARAAAALLLGERHARDVARAAHALVTEHYGWEASAAAVEAAWRRACALHDVVNGALR
jgi:sugar transferase (PEP-CTERM/EpsH1 system associated)